MFLQSCYGLILHFFFSRIIGRVWILFGIKDSTIYIIWCMLNCIVFPYICLIESVIHLGVNIYNANGLINLTFLSLDTFHYVLMAIEFLCFFFGQCNIFGISFIKPVGFRCTYADMKYLISIFCKFRNTCVNYYLFKLSSGVFCYH